MPEFVGVFVEPVFDAAAGVGAGGVDEVEDEVAFERGQAAGMAEVVHQHRQVLRGAEVVGEFALAFDRGWLFLAAGGECRVLLQQATATAAPAVPVFRVAAVDRALLGLGAAAQTAGDGGVDAGVVDIPPRQCDQVGVRVAQLVAVFGQRRVFAQGFGELEPTCFEQQTTRALQDQAGVLVFVIGDETVQRLDAGMRVVQFGQAATGARDAPVQRLAIVLAFEAREREAGAYPPQRLARLMHAAVHAPPGPAQAIQRTQQLRVRIGLQGGAEGVVAHGVMRTWRRRGHGAILHRRT